MNSIEIPLTEHRDVRGALVAINGGVDIPFAIGRVYFIYANEVNVRRGYHAHKALRQLLVCVSGSCKILLDNGTDKSEVLLRSPNQGILIMPSIWHEMYDFSPTCVLMSIASAPYDAADYIRDYSRFLEWVAGNDRS